VWLLVRHVAVEIGHLALLGHWNEQGRARADALVEADAVRDRAVVESWTEAEPDDVANAGSNRRAGECHWQASVNESGARAARHRSPSPSQLEHGLRAGTGVRTVETELDVSNLRRTC